MRIYLSRKIPLKKCHKVHNLECYIQRFLRSLRGTELILVRGKTLLQFSVLIFLVGPWIFIQAFNFSSGDIIVYNRMNQLNFSDCLQQIILNINNQIYMHS